MKMHKHVICNSKNIMGSAQSNPTSTQSFQRVNTHLKCMKQCYNANEMQCMMIESHFHNAHPKNFTKTPLILKTPQFIKNPKS